MAIDPTTYDQVIGSGDSVNYDGYKLLMSYVSGTGTPVSNLTPQFIGQEYFDTAAEAFYKATGVTDTDWKQITA